MRFCDVLYLLCAESQDDDVFFIEFTSVHMCLIFIILYCLVFILLYILIICK